MNGSPSTATTSPGLVFALIQSATGRSASAWLGAAGSPQSEHADGTGERTRHANTGHRAVPRADAPAFDGAAREQHPEQRPDRPHEAVRRIRPCEDEGE